MLSVGGSGGWSRECPVHPLWLALERSGWLPGSRRGVARNRREHRPRIRTVPPRHHPLDDAEEATFTAPHARQRVGVSSSRQGAPGALPLVRAGGAGEPACRRGSVERDSLTCGDARICGLTRGNDLALFLTVSRRFAASCVTAVSRGRQRPSHLGATMGAVPLWSTGPPGAPSSIGHRMQPDAHGRPTTPLCGCSTHGLWFRRDHRWEQVPQAQRCAVCSSGLAQRRES